MSDGGVKFDKGKANLSLLPKDSLWEIAQVLEFGAVKYSPYNWRKGFDYSRLVSAAMRHITQFNDGQDKDAETDLSHLAHAICCLMFLLEQTKHGTGKDDRYVHKAPSKKTKRRR